MLPISQKFLQSEDHEHVQRHSDKIRDRGTSKEVKAEEKRIRERYEKGETRIRMRKEEISVHEQEERYTYKER